MKLKIVQCVEVDLEDSFFTSQLYRQCIGRTPMYDRVLVHLGTSFCKLYAEMEERSLSVETYIDILITVEGVPFSLLHLHVAL